VSPRTRSVRLDGVVLLDKPSGISSNAALQRVRRALGAAKAGHAGTLDPLASGLLPLLLGEATKLAGALLDAEKRYEATVTLGTTTTTGDAEGAVLERRPVAVTQRDLDLAAARFQGEVEQVPPMHSALKHRGRPLYDYARRGVSVARAPRRVTIHALTLELATASTVRLRLRCSKGTYVRTLAEDLGAVLGCGAHLSALRRTGVGPFGLGDAIALDALESAPPAERRGCIRPIEVLVAHLPEVELPAPLAGRFRQGQVVPTGSSVPPGAVRVLGPERRFLGLGEGAGGGAVRPTRLVRPPAETL
jgi:tRNA pseudouridine55 synthase